MLNISVFFGYFTQNLLVYINDVQCIPSVKYNINTRDFMNTVVIILESTNLFLGLYI